MNPDNDARLPPIIPDDRVPPVIPRSLPEALPVHQRMEALDVLRGFAVLGILIMNIQSFSMIDAAYNNPAAFGDFTGLNRWVWLLSHIFADQKFMSIFSLLFGAGIILMATRLEAQGSSAAWLHYRRMFWLLLFGLAHAYLFWHGDILFTYALAGSVAFLFRNLRPGWLVFWACASLLIPFLLFLGFGATIPFWPEETLQELRQDWHPDAAAVARELQTYRGNWLGVFLHRAPNALAFQTFLFAVWAGWRAGGLMLLGMALMKWSVFTAQKPARTYLAMILLGAAVGLPLITFGVHRHFQENWSVAYSMFTGSQWNYWGSLGLATSYLGLVMLVQQRRLLSPVRRVLAAVGRMALTNYLLQTLICTTLFYGYGFGWFGRLERWQQIIVVVAVWLLQVLFTLAWLRRYRQGPFEYLWRSLTYFRLTPNRKQPGPAPV